MKYPVNVQFASNWFWVMDEAVPSYRIRPTIKYAFRCGLRQLPPTQWFESTPLGCESGARLIELFSTFWVRSSCVSSIFNGYSVGRFRMGRVFYGELARIDDLSRPRSLLAAWYIKWYMTRAGWAGSPVQKTHRWLPQPQNIILRKMQGARHR